ncbi:MAG: hypothetical protein K2G45_12725 [Lachnospiraceae bacterium]|nr:hypothetical protein [Lachnospiraceae bacterium]
MDAIIGLVVSFLGYMCYDIDFCTLFTCVSIALSLYDYINDEAANR